MTGDEEPAVLGRAAVKSLVAAGGKAPVPGKLLRFSVGPGGLQVGVCYLSSTIEAAHYDSPRAMSVLESSCMDNLSRQEANLCPALLIHIATVAAHSLYRHSQH